MLLFEKNDQQANWLIGILSILVFATVIVLSRIQLKVNVGFDVHVFARINAVINSVVSILLLAGLITARHRLFVWHQRIMLTAIGLSVLFLVSYVAHHLLAESTRYGGVGWVRYMYLLLLISHIVLAAIILPFILHTAYRALTGQYKRHKRLARLTWPIWFYVSVTGVLVYLMISPYYK